MNFTNHGPDKLPRPAVLIVDDEADTRHLLRLYLEREGFDITEAGDGREALKQFQEHVSGGRPFSAVVLDLMLPGIDGWEVCQRLRESSRVPVLMLSARGEIHERLHGFQLGADDYVPKPFDPREVAARVKALVARGDSHPPGAEGVRTFGPLSVDTAGRTVRIAGRPVHLTPKEFDLLVSLTDHPGQTLSRQQLLDRVWGYAHAAEDRLADSHIKNLREKLGREGAGQMITTIWGIGYRFDPPGA
ncbi:MAG: response regulator transcription factor [Thermaerobacterales bacterium]